jgi:protoporphyrinogen oxidase
LTIDTSPAQRVIVIGAGIAGLTAADRRMPDLPELRPASDVSLGDRGDLC